MSKKVSVEVIILMRTANAVILIIKTINLIATAMFGLFFSALGRFFYAV